MSEYEHELIGPRTPPLPSGQEDENRGGEPSLLPDTPEPNIISSSSSSRVPQHNNFVSNQQIGVDQQLLVTFPPPPKTGLITQALHFLIVQQEKQAQYPDEYKITCRLQSHKSVAGGLKGFLVEKGTFNTSHNIFPEHRFKDLGKHGKARVEKINTEYQDVPQPTPMNAIVLMQIASEHLGQGPASTMRIAKKLYTKGYITDPETLEKSYKPGFPSKEYLASIITQLDEVCKLRLETQKIMRNFVVPTEQLNNVQNKGESEPIYPRILDPDPKIKRASLENEEIQLLEFICTYFIATCMRPLSLTWTTIEFDIGHEKFVHRYNRIAQLGFTIAASWMKTKIVKKSEELDLKIREFLASDPKKVPIVNKAKSFSESEFIGLLGTYGVGIFRLPEVFKTLISQKYIEIINPGRRVVASEKGINYYKSMRKQMEQANGLGLDEAGSSQHSMRTEANELLMEHEEVSSNESLQDSEMLEDANERSSNAYSMLTRNSTDKTSIDTRDRSRRNFGEYSGRIDGVMNPRNKQVRFQSPAFYIRQRSKTVEPEGEYDRSRRRRQHYSPSPERPVRSLSRSPVKYNLRERNRTRRQMSPIRSRPVVEYSSTRSRHLFPQQQQEQRYNFRERPHRPVYAPAPPTANTRWNARPEYQNNQRQIISPTQHSPTQRVNGFVPKNYFAGPPIQQECFITQSQMQQTSPQFHGGVQRQHLGSAAIGNAGRSGGRNIGHQALALYTTRRDQQNSPQGNYTQAQQWNTPRQGQQTPASIKWAARPPAPANCAPKPQLKRTYTYYQQAPAYTAPTYGTGANKRRANNDHNWTPPEEFTPRRSARNQQRNNGHVEMSEFFPR